ncbi:MAG: helix-turn-helix transcriptional regulator [Pseudomonadota bacterium]
MRESDITKRFGLRVRSLRLAAGFSQEGFADVVGIHRTYIGAIERGEKTATIETAAKLAMALQLSLSDLFKEL